MNENMAILWENSGFDAAGLSLAVGAAKSGWPLANVQDTVRKRVFKSDATGQVSVGVDFGSSVLCSSLGLVEFDFSIDATALVRGYDAAGSQNLDAGGAVDKGGGLVGLPCTGHGFSSGDLISLADTVNYNGFHTLDATTTANELVLVATYAAETFTGSETAYKLTQTFASEEWLIWPPVWGAGEIGAGVDGAGGAPSATDVAHWPRATRVFLWDPPTFARFWVIELDNGSAEFMLGRVFLCDVWQPRDNFEVSWSYKLEDPSTTQWSLARVPWTQEMDRYYVYEVRPRYLTQGEAFGRLLQIANMVGVHADCILCLFPGDDYMKNFTTAHGRFATMPQVKQWHHGRSEDTDFFETTLRFREV